MHHIAVIDRAFFEYRQSEHKGVPDSLIISKPGHMLDGVYYPPESVALYGDNLFSELFNFLREVHNKEKQAIHDRELTPTIQLPEPSEGSAGGLPEVSNPQLQPTSEGSDIAPIYL